MARRRRQDEKKSHKERGAVRKWSMDVKRRWQDREIVRKKKQGKTERSAPEHDSESGDTGNSNGASVAINTVIRKNGQKKKMVTA